MDKQELIALAEKVDQDVREAAIRWGLKWENYGNCEVEGIRAGAYDGDDLLAAFAEMKAAGRQKGLREAAEVATRTHAPFTAAAITALMEGEGK